MKKLFVLICFILFALPCFAEYLPIPKEKSAQYKAEIEKIIKKQIPLSIKIVNNVFDDIEIKYRNFKKQQKKVGSESDKKLLCESNLRYEITDIGSPLDIGEGYIYAEIVEKTADYVSIDKDSILNISFPTDTAIFLEPYFEDNHINIDNLKNFLDYAEKKNKIYEKYKNNINNYCYFLK